MSQASSLSRSVQFVAGFVAILAATSSAFSGFVTFGFAQAHLGVLGAALLLIVTAATSRGAERPAWPAALWAIGAVYVAAHAALSGGDAAWDAAALVVTAAGVAIAATFGQRPLRSGLACGLGTASLGAAGVVAAQAMGMEVPPAIPRLTDYSVIFGLFDSPQAAASFFAVAMGANAAAAVAQRGVPRVVSALGAAASALALGVVDVPVVIAVLAGSAILSVLVLIVVRRDDAQARRVAAAWAALLVVAAASAVIAPTRGDDDRVRFEFDDRAVPAAYRPEFIDGAALDEMRWHFDAVLAYAREAGVLGQGGGGWAAHGSAAYDRDQTPGLMRTEGWDAPVDTYSAVLQLSGDFGWLAGIALVGALLAGFERGSRRDAPGVVTIEDGGASAVAAAAALGVLVFSPGAAAAAVFAAAALASVGAEERAIADDATPSKTGLLVALMAAAALTWPSVEALRWGHATAAGDVRLANGEFERAIAFYDEAEAHGERFESVFNEALAVAFRPGPREQSAGAVDGFRRAIELREASVRARYQQANLFVRSLVNRRMEAGEVETRRMTVIASLQRVLEIDPNYVDAALLLSQIHVARVDPASAVTILERMARRSLPADALAELFENVGQIEMDYLERPEKALAAYRSALRFERDARRRADAMQRMETLEEWIHSGSRPLEGVEAHPH